jgi:hypothetical protein
MIALPASGSAMSRRWPSNEESVTERSSVRAISANSAMIDGMRKSQPSPRSRTGMAESNKRVSIVDMS